MIKKTDCNYFNDGVFNYTIKDTDQSQIGVGVIDFWFVQGDCDKYAIIIIDGDGYRVELQFNMD
jgi:hypothetical protein